VTIFKSPHSLVSNPNGSILVGGVDVEFLDSVRVLGVTLDCSLSWRPHINDVVHKLTRTTSVLCRLRRIGFPRDLLVRIYRSLTESSLLYCLCVWGTAGTSHLEAVRVAQKNALRAIFGLGPFSSVANIRSRYRLMSLDQLIDWRLYLLAYKSCHQQLPSHLTSSFRTPSPFNLRVNSQLDLVSIFSPTEFVRRSPLYRMITIWNSLPLEIRASPSLSCFNRKVRYHLLP